MGNPPGKPRWINRKLGTFITDFELKGQRALPTCPAASDHPPPRGGQYAVGEPERLFAIVENNPALRRGA